MRSDPSHPRCLAWLARALVCGGSLALAVACESKQPEPKPEPVTPKPVEPKPKPKPKRQPCPSPDAKDVLAHPKVKEKIRDAWAKSKPGEPDEHEEQFWVGQRRMPKGTGSETRYDYRVDIFDGPAGDESSAGMVPPIKDYKGRWVLHVHTHPGPPGEADEDHINDEPSPADIEAQDQAGVPMAIVHGADETLERPSQPLTFPLPDGTALPRARELKWECKPDPGAKSKPPPPPPPREPSSGPPACEGCGRATGDPHLATHDGVRYDLQAAGEFVAVEHDKEARVQLRMEPWGQSRAVSVVTAVALRVGPARVSIRPDQGLFVDGEPVTLRPVGVGMARRGEIIDTEAEPGADPPPTHALEGGGQIRRFGRDYVIDGPEGSRTWVQLGGGSLNVFYQVPADATGQIRGLFGSPDGDPDNDFATRAGEQLGPKPSFEALYGVFANSWRVADGESLFDYEPGQTSASFRDLTMPERALTLDELDASARASAEARCRAHGVRDPAALAECTLDLAVTDDLGFVRAALALEAIDGTIPTLSGAAELRPSAGQRGFRVTYEVREQNQRPTQMSVVSDPPREVVIRAGIRQVFDGERSVQCSGTGDATRCVELGAEPPSATTKLGDFGLREQPATLRAWLDDPSSVPERVEGQTIIGREAVCKVSGDPRALTSTVCYDLEFGVVLRMAIAIAGSDAALLRFEAVEFGQPRASDFALPDRVERLPP